MDYEIAEVIVKEAVYKNLKDRGCKVVDHSVSVLRGSGDYGTYSGEVVHLTEEGQFLCGEFQVGLVPGEYFPEVCVCSVKIEGDHRPLKKIWTRQEI